MPLQGGLRLARRPGPGRQPQATLEGHKALVGYLSFSPDGKTLASGSSDHTIKLWDVATGRNTATLKEERPYLWGCVAFSPDGKQLATGGWFNKVKLWDLGTRKGRLLLDEEQQCPDTLVAFSPDGKALASGGVCRNAMRLYDVATGKSTATLVTWKGGNPEGVVAMMFTPDGRTLISAGRPDEIKLWEVATGKHRATRKTAEEFFGAAFSPDGKTLATTAYDDNRITLYDVATAKARLSLPGDGGSVRPRPIVFSPDGRTLASGSEDGTVKLWDVAGGKALASFKGHADAVACLAFSPGGQLLASGGADRTIKLWRVMKAR
jgi:WD40 repeat protein